MNRDDLINMYDFTGKTFAVTGAPAVLGRRGSDRAGELRRERHELDRNLARLPAIQESAGAVWKPDRRMPGRRDEPREPGGGRRGNQGALGTLYAWSNAAGGNSPKATVSRT